MQADRGVPPVDHPDGSGNEVPFLQHAVVQFHLHMGGGVLQADHQSLPPLVPPESGQALQAVFARTQLVVHIAQVRHMAAVLGLKFQGGQAEIPHAAGGVLLGQGFQGVVPAVARLVGVGRRPPVCKLDEIGQIAAADAGAVVGVQQHPVLVGFHLIGCALGVQGKDVVLRIEYDHKGYPQ